MKLLILHCGVQSLMQTPRISTSSRGLYTERSLRVWIFTWTLKLKAFGFCYYVHLAFNLKQWKNKKIIYSVSCKCQELEKNLRVVHKQVARNHFLISAGKQNEKKKTKTSKSRWRTVRPLKGLAISLKHTWKRKLNTNAATVHDFHWAPPEWLARR